MGEQKQQGMKKFELRVILDKWGNPVRALPDGTYWSSLFYSDNLIFSEEEKEELTNWFYQELLSEDQRVFRTALFEKEELLFSRPLYVGKDLAFNYFEMFVYSSGPSFGTSMKELNKLVRHALIKNSLSIEAFFFVSVADFDFAKHDFHYFGAYLFEIEHFDDYELCGNFNHIFDLMLNPIHGFDPKHCCQAVGCVVGINKDWMLMFDFNNRSEKKQVDIRLFGPTLFCSDVRSKIPR